MAARTSEDRALQAWDVADVEFDADGTFEEKALALLRFAVLAPSGHNTQPWRFLIRQGSVDFLADRSRRLEVVDPDDRELVMSVGAAVGTFCVAAHHFGQATSVATFPEPDDLDLVASLRLRPAAAHDHDLFAAIPTRRTTRAAFDERTVLARGGTCRSRRRLRRDRGRAPPRHQAMRSALRAPRGSPGHTQQRSVRWSASFARWFTSWMPAYGRCFSTRRVVGPTLAGPFGHHSLYRRSAAEAYPGRIALQEWPSSRRTHVQADPPHLPPRSWPREATGVGANDPSDVCPTALLPIDERP
jgi:nitroreductase